VPVTPRAARGVGCVEAPRGTLIHDYETDENGLVTDVNLIVGTTHNNAPINMSVKQAAQTLIKDGGSDPDQGRRLRSGHPQPGRDGHTRLRSVPVLRDARAVGQDPGEDRDQRPGWGDRRYAGRLIAGVRSRRGWWDMATGSRRRLSVRPRTARWRTVGPAARNRCPTGTTNGS